jgi:hypothetical protein
MRVSPLLLLVVLFGIGIPRAAAVESPGETTAQPPPAWTATGNAVLQSGSSSFRSPARQVTPDTLFVYGGPGTNEGKFQDPSGIIPDRQGWTGVDETDLPTIWQRSQFNAENLNDHGAGNWAMWCGQDESQSPGWVAAPGYGNSWNAILIWESPQLSNPAAGQTVGLDFFFNHDSEPGYDFFLVEYDSAGFWLQLLSLDGYNGEHSPGGGIPAPPGVQYSLAGARPIVYAGNDYAGTEGDRIRLRMRFASDGAWSDEDGLWPTNGAAQVDDISVTWGDGSSFEDFESPGPYEWRPNKAPFVGDFSKVFARITDLDPCRDNNSPVMGFVDDGSEVNNADSAALIPGYPTSTGGTLSLNWSYGVPGGWVVNYNGGLTFGMRSLDNAVVSPPIAWDLPGPEDDGIDWAGAILRFDVYEHLNLIDGMFRNWSIRSSEDGGSTWSEWRDRNFVYYSATPRWLNAELNVSDLLEPARSHVQIRLGVVDLASVFAFIGGDASPSPFFDNVALAKVRVTGPSITTRDIDLANDGFPPVGNIDASTQAARDQLDVPFDMARNVSTGDLNIPGDSVVADIRPGIPGTTISDLRMFWVLDRNTLFDDVRQAPSRPVDENVDLNFGVNQWAGEVVGQQSTLSTATPIADRFFFDLQDVNFLYPGDVCRYYLQATDSDGRATTLPPVMTGFETGVGYSRVFTVNGLPSITLSGGGGGQPGVIGQPSILVINDFFNRGLENELLLAYGQMGLTEGVDFDIYEVLGPSSSVDNGIGPPGAHGANAQQLEGYRTIVYHAGDLNNVLSDGSGWGGYDLSDDIGVLSAWHDRPGQRNFVIFGDNAVSGSINSTNGGVFIQNVLGVQLNDRDVGNDIGGQTAPVVEPTLPAFVSSFVAYGGCLGINTFDNLSALAPAVRSHAWLATDGSAYPNLAAGIVHDRLDQLNDRKVDITFPFGFSYVYDLRARQVPGQSARTRLLREVFDYVAEAIFYGPATSNAASVTALSLSAAPNPFNPRTVIRLATSRAGQATVRVLDLRGRVVNTLLQEDVEVGPLEIPWDGRDHAGATIASGVYLVEAQVAGERALEKIVLLK